MYLMFASRDATLKLFYAREEIQNCCCGRRGNHIKRLQRRLAFGDVVRIQTHVVSSPVAAPHTGPGRPVPTLEFAVPTLQKCIVQKTDVYYIV